MGIFQTIGRVFKGNTSKAESKLKNTEAYWDGLSKSIDEKVADLENRLIKAGGILGTKNQRLETAKKNYEQMKASAEQSREKFKETNDPKHKSNAMNCFNLMNSHKASMDILQAEVDELSKLVKDLEDMKRKATTAATKKKSEILKAKSRVEFNNAVGSITEGIKDFTSMELDGADEVDNTYHENIIRLQSINDNIVEVYNEEDDFDKFFNEGAK